MPTELWFAEFSRGFILETYVAGDTHGCGFRRDGDDPSRRAMNQTRMEVELPVRLGLGLEALADQIVGACNDTRKFAFWADDWIVKGNEVYRAQFALPAAIAKAERVTGLNAIVVTVSLTGDGQAQVGLRLSDEVEHMTDAFREFVDRVAARLEHAGFY